MPAGTAAGEVADSVWRWVALGQPHYPPLLAAGLGIVGHSAGGLRRRAAAVRQSSATRDGGASPSCFHRPARYPGGRIAQLLAVAKPIGLVEYGDHPDCVAMTN